MIKIGLTGGIGSGKSTVSAIFQSLGVPVIDADLIARRLIRENKQIRHQIQTAFGTEILNDEEQIERRKLRELIFSDPQKKKILEDIMHPVIKDKIQEMSKEIYAPYCIIAIPLLIEANMLDLIDNVVVVDCSESQQINRVMERDHCSKKQVLDIIQTQLDRRKRTAKADFIIDNSSTPEHLKNQLLSVKAQWDQHYGT